MGALIFLTILYLAGGIAFVVANCTVSAIDKRLNYHLPIMALHLLIWFPLLIYFVVINIYITSLTEE